LFTSNSDILTNLGQFITDLFSDLTSGLLFFGGPLDIVVAVLDILATALVVYYVLKILRDSRAWQLLKGLLLIIGFAVLCSLAGLTTVGFLLNNTISVLAIAFVVIFQPELRRALEAFGRNSFNVISSAISQDEPARSSGSVHNLIESIVRACEKLSETRTGALIILERKTRLGELIEQENVVQLDAAVSATMLLQIFYKGSPLHDGAVLIRDGRLTAARVHVPLSDNYHLRKDYGTRHRAAIGASEMGDAIAVVVSEERGCISLTLEGRLYTMDNADALRALLHKLLNPARPGVSLSNLGNLFRPGRWQSRQNGQAAETADTSGIKADLPDPMPGTAGTRRHGRRPFNQIFSKQRLMLLVWSLAIAIVMWLYVQVTVNPVDSRTFSVPLNTTKGIEWVSDKELTLEAPSPYIQITLQGRRMSIENLKTDAIEAYLDFSRIDSAGTYTLNVLIKIRGLTYIQPSSISPASVMVTVKKK
jgi:diadenylate cyclase